MPFEYETVSGNPYVVIVYYDVYINPMYYWANYLGGVMQEVEDSSTGEQAVMFEFPTIKDQIMFIEGCERNMK